MFVNPTHLSGTVNFNQELLSNDESYTVPLMFFACTEWHILFTFVYLGLPVERYTQTIYSKMMTLMTDSEIGHFARCRFAFIVVGFDLQLRELLDSVVDD
jgi:hypothetical protein